MTSRDDPKAQLWRPARRALVGNVGRTVWVSGDGYWLAHRSLVGPPPAKPEQQSIKTSSIRDVVARYTADARRPPAGLAIEHVGDHVVVGLAAFWGHTVALSRTSPIRVAFDPALFEPLRRCADHAGYEMRLDPWRQAVSWWHPRGYPVAVILCVHATDDRGWAT